MPTKKTTQKLVPELRFPEFREDWCLAPMGELYSFIPTNSFSRDTMNEGSGEVRNIHYGDIHTKLPALLDLESTDLPCLNASISLKKFKQHNFCKEGDVIFADASEDIDDVGKSIEVVNTHGLQVLSGLHTIHARQKTARFIVGFAGHLFHSDGIRIQIQRESQGAKVLGISGTRLSAVEVHFPEDKPEQQKIADCLGSLDALLAAHRRKLAALQDHKKGLLQQLFPSVEGASSSPTRKQREQDAPTTIQTTPNLRFPGFEGEWESVSLGEIADIKLGKMLDRKKHTSGRLLPYLNNLSVRWGKVETADLPRMFFNDNELERYGLKAEDVLVCEGGEPGRSAVWDGRLPEMKYQKAVHRVRFRIRFNPHLLVHYLEAIAGTPQLEMLFTGGGIKHLTRETFSKLTIPLPNPPEQQKIADCLSALDALITAQAAQLAALQAHKKGLMQKLFPNPEGIA